MPLRRTLGILEHGIDEGLHRGGQLHVRQGDRVVADEAFGEARQGESMRPDHLMLWLSAGKPVTAVAIGQLWESGALDIDDPVVRHVPEFGAHGKDAVTIRHLLTHTAGIRALNLGWPGASWEEVLAKIFAMKLEPGWRPGAKAGYHLSSSWFVLGEIVQRVSGRELPDYVRTRIFEPLGMADCWIGMPAARYAQYGATIAPVYDTEANGSVNGWGSAHGWTDEAHVTGCSPGANAIGPMRQLARFYSMLLAGGEADGTRILASPTVAALTARHRVGLWDHTFRHQLDWGLGLIVNSAHHGEKTSPYGYGPRASHRAFGHSGYRSVVAFADPEHQLVVCLAVNGTPKDAAHRDRFNAATEAIYADLGITGPDPPAALSGRRKPG